MGDTFKICEDCGVSYGEIPHHCKISVPEVLVRKLANEHFQKIEDLTQKQFEDALLQAIKSGDFIRCVEHCMPNLYHSQGVMYVPYAQKMTLQLQIEDFCKLKEKIKNMAPKYAGCEILVRDFPEIFGEE